MSIRAGAFNIMPTPKKQESRQKYVARCIPIRRKEHPDESRERSIRVCFEMYRAKKGAK